MREGIALRKENLYTHDVKSRREIKVRKFRSFEEERAADNQMYREMTPQERVNLLLELVAQHNQAHGIEPRLKRVHRIVKLSSC